MISRPKHPGVGRRYLFAVLAAAVATAIKLALAVGIGFQAAFLFYFSAVVVSAWYGGFGPSILCSILCGLAGNFLFMPALAVPSSAPLNLLKTFVFIAEAMLIGAMNRSRLRAKQNADEQQHLLQMMLGNIGDAVLTTNIRGQIETMNPAAQSLTGWTEAEAHGHVCGTVARIKTTVHPVSEALESGSPFRGSEPLELIRRNGAIAYVEVAVIPILLPRGTVAGSMVTMRDRTAHIANQRNLETALAQTTDILESISNGFYHLDAEWRFTYVNREAERMLRRSRKDLTGKNFWEEYPDARDGVFFAEFQRAVTAKNGSRFVGFYDPWNTWFEVHAFPSKDGLSVYFTDVTSRKQLEADRELLFEEVSSERRRLEAILTNLPAGVLIVDGAGKLLLANNQVEKTLGFCPIATESIEDFSGYRAFHPETGELLSPAEYPVIQSLQHGATILNRDIWVHSIGGDRLLEVSSTPLRNSEGTIHSAVMIFQDATERRRTQTALAQARQEIASVLDAINEGFASLDADLRFVYLNPAAGRMLKIEPGERTALASGLRILDVLEASEIETLLAEIRKVLENGQPLQCEQFYAPWGCWFEIRIYRNRDGGVALYLNDITAKRTTDEALQRSEHRYRSLVRASAQIVWTAGPDGGFHQPQNSWADYTGQPWPAHEGAGTLESIHPEDHERVETEWALRMAKGLPFRVGYRLWNSASGEYRECLSRAVPIRDQSGAIQEWIGTITDVHDRKRLEEKLLQTAKLESLGVLAGGIAHDFNNLLTGILGSASFLLEEIPLGAPLRPLVQTLNDASERAAQLTRQMLAYSGKGRFILEIVDVSEQVKQIGELLRASIPRHVEIRWDLSADSVVAEVDSSQLQQLVMNLVLNGAEAIPEGHGSVWVSTRREFVERPHETLIGDLPMGDYAVIEIRDNGTGMDEETRRRIFDPFFTTKFTGRGLGLAAALGIVRAHSGGIDLHTAPGQGTTFLVYLPAVASRPHSNYTEEETDSPFPEQVNGTVLVVDDEPVVIDTATRLLKPYGWTIDTARNGLEALRVLAMKKDGISLVLLDVAMPVMGGIETARRIREADERIPIVVMSGYDELETLRQFSSQVNGFLQKPFTLNELEKAVGLATKRTEGASIYSRSTPD